MGRTNDKQVSAPDGAPWEVFGTRGDIEEAPRRAGRGPGRRAKDRIGPCPSGCATECFR